MLVEGPGIVIGRKGNVGSVWWVEGPFFPIDTAYYVESDLPLGFLYWLLSGVDFIDSHAAVPGLSREQAIGVRVVIPPVDIVQQFDEANAALFRDIRGCRLRSNQVAAARDLLLPRLVSGQLDISDIDLGVLTPAETE
jgi:type I restriction enzyme S subunit